MNFSFYIAKRYIFSKKSHNAVNVISLISVCGIAIATMAMVCTLSVFNGFTDIAVKSFSSIETDLQVTPAQGKVFTVTDTLIRKIKEIEGVDIVSESLEENALIRYGERQVAALVKGVSPEFLQQIDPEKITVDGQFLLEEGDVEFSVVGVGLAMPLGLRANYIAPLEIYSPKRDVKVNMANPANAFSRSFVYASGIFAINQVKYDEQVIFVSMNMARELFRYDEEVSSLNISLNGSKSTNTVKRELKELLGSGYLVKDRFEQQEEAFRMVNIEKWVTYLILLFIIVIAVFNIIGSLSMLILEKEEDISILRNLGANNKTIVSIFRIEGWLISLSGTIVGLIIGLILCLLQQHFGLLKLGETAGAFIIDSYPVAVRFSDIVVIFLTVSFIGILAVLYPTNNLKKHLR